MFYSADWRPNAKISLIGLNVIYYYFRRLRCFAPVRKKSLANARRCGPLDCYSVGMSDAKIIALFDVLLDAHLLKLKLRKDFVPGFHGHYSEFHNRG